MNKKYQDLTSIEKEIFDAYCDIGYYPNGDWVNCEIITPEQYEIILNTRKRLDGDQ